MKDFANFDRQQSYFRPYQTHLDVYVRLKEVSLKAVLNSVWTYKIKIFCSVPVILFQCELAGCNVLMHINMPALAKLSATSWLQTKRLTFMLLISDASQGGQVIGAKTIRLSHADSALIRRACQNQRAVSSMQIEHLVDILYQLDIDNIWQSQ